MSLLRALAVALIVSLLLVPAVARAGQSLDTGRTPAPVSSFSKSGNVPPDPVVILPDYSVTPVYVLTLLQPVRRFVVPADEALPTTPTVSDGEALRAPPIRTAA